MSVINPLVLEPSMNTPNSSQLNPPRSERVLLVPPDRLIPGPNAPASVTAHAALIESVRTYGVLQPLLARQTPEGLEVLAGFRRLEAAKEAGLEEVPVRVYKVETGAISGFYAASNLQGERRRIAPPSPPSLNSEGYKPVSHINGLLEEELNQPGFRTPFKAILSIALIVILVLWAGLNLSRCRGPRPEPADPGISDLERGSPDPAAPTTPTRTETGPASPTTPRTGTTPARRFTVEDWRRILTGIDGVEVRDVNGIPRVVFLNPVFSRLHTIDPAQHSRLTRVAQTIREACGECILVVIGHTDNDPVRPGGAFNSNDHLGELRANEVVQYLTTRAGVPSSRVRPVTSGERDPPFPNTPASNKARNRTVTIEILQPRDS